MPLYRALAARIDSGLAPDVTAVSMAANGTILSTSADPSRDATPGTQYAMVDDYQLPGSSCVETISRDDLIEIARLAPFVDLVTPVSSPSRRLVFKYYEDGDAIPRIWHSIRIPAMLSAHPNIVSAQHLVVHEKRGTVVGFTVPFIPGGSLLATRASRTFKLKWAKQLFRTIDDLNLTYGIVHHDVRLHNLMVDPATDDLVLIDFDRAAKPGGHGKVPDHYLPPATEKQLPQQLPALSLPPSPLEFRRLMGLEDPDAYAAIVEVYGLVTQSPTRDTWIKSDGGHWDQAAINDAVEGPWIAHPDARLDHPAQDYHAALVDWLSRRRQLEGGHARKEPPPLDFADHMPVPPADLVKVPNYQDPLDPYSDRQPPSAPVIPVSGYKYLRRDAVQHGRAVVEWARPASVARDRTRTLLATGQYADELSLPRHNKVAEPGSAVISIPRRSKRLAAMANAAVDEAEQGQ
ncbi:hypothetical protein B0T25DRAFT_445896 [Lasiosphaeria hispida]|uniref:Aminoglycoside phosphotransferase domain-containing protein n=1 Tax=Lasiosphaeria hispida TaxID=260671 RepID=A0AAJ0HXT3_9PEZI|nr:hypothetical protein B0T25DRAFT_445896 [Lasiosphaeria hispida]